MEQNNVIGAFSEAQASAISGLSAYQLRQWQEWGLFEPGFVPAKKGTPFGRIYSFRDLVTLQILNDLRNNKKIPLAHLREVSLKLAHLGEERWIATTLYVLGKRVVFENPSSHQREEVVSGQRVFDIPLRVVARNTREKIRALNDRTGKEGEVEKHRFVSGNRRVFAGTRIPVQAVIDFLKAGYTADQILREYPELTAKDVRSAKTEAKSQAA
ncbi:MAG: DUF433 domain-containing protein [Pseudomonadota bacterium]